jgi:hypothetical protein
MQEMCSAVVCQAWIPHSPPGIRVESVLRYEHGLPPPKLMLKFDCHCGGVGRWSLFEVIGSLRIMNTSFAGLG